jgi:hypothetical protein
MHKNGSLSESGIQFAKRRPICLYNASMNVEEVEELLFYTMNDSPQPHCSSTIILANVLKRSGHNILIFGFVNVNL